MHSQFVRNDSNNVLFFILQGKIVEKPRKGGKADRGGARVLARLRQAEVQAKAAQDHAVPHSDEETATEEQVRGKITLVMLIHVNIFGQISQAKEAGPSAKEG